MMLYGQFVGSWEIDATGYEQGGGTTKVNGEWHFSWIRGGRGMQDVLYASGAPAEQYGTTLRCYDTALDAWHITWMQPSSGQFVHLLGRKAGDRIVQEGVGTGHHRRERWSFTDITSASFLWPGEASFDNGVTWTLMQEMRANRLQITD